LSAVVVVAVWLLLFYGHTKSALANKTENFLTETPSVNMDKKTGKRTDRQIVGQLVSSSVCSAFCFCLLSAIAIFPLLVSLIVFGLAVVVVVF